MNFSDFAISGLTKPPFSAAFQGEKSGLLAVSYSRWALVELRAILLTYAAKKNIRRGDLSGGTTFDD